MRGALSAQLAKWESLRGNSSKRRQRRGFGMTETNGLGIRLSGKEYIDHPSAAGRLIPPVQALRIVADDGTVSATGVVGELLLKSAATMRGYLNKPEQTQAVLRNGWLRTGDLAYQDAQGLVYIVGRKKDMIIRGGENIACPEGRRRFAPNLGGAGSLRFLHSSRTTGRNGWSRYLCSVTTDTTITAGAA